MKQLISMALGAMFFVLTLILLILMFTPIGGIHFLFLAIAVAVLAFIVIDIINAD
jgi:hypothetical protein